MKTVLGIFCFILTIPAWYFLKPKIKNDPKISILIYIDAITAVASLIGMGLVLIFGQV
jgi:hypothetical protein